MIQFGLGTLQADDVTFGYVQNCTIDFGFDDQSLHGEDLYPVDIRVHTGGIDGSAEFAAINAEAIHKLLGGTRTLGEIDLDSTDFPGTWQLVWHMTTDSAHFTITMNLCRSIKLSLALTRETFLIPAFDFKCYADENGDVFEIFGEGSASTVDHKDVDGNLVWYMTDCLTEDIGANRWVDIMGEKTVMFKDHPGSVNLMEVTQINTSSQTSICDYTGGYQIYTGGTNGDGINAQVIGYDMSAGGSAYAETYNLDADWPCYFGCSWLIVDPVNTMVFLGLHQRSTSIYPTSLGHCVGFAIDAGDSNIDCVTHGSSETRTYVANMPSATAKRMEFYWDGTDVKFYLDGVLMATHTTNIPTSNLLATIVFRTSENSNQNIAIEHFRAIQSLNY